MNPLFLILTLCGGIFLLSGYIQLRFPPKKINHLYGYRTATSMRSQECWDFAQAFSAKKMIKMSTYIIALGLLSWFVDLQHFWAFGLALTIVILMPLLMLFQVERELKKRFPKPPNKTA
ncbi:MAG: SdpI family protein [Flavobacteriaceae bacterium]